MLYINLRNGDFNRRLEVSRNLVRLLIEQKTFVPQDERHRIEIAERCALKLKHTINEQEREREQRERSKQQIKQTVKDNYLSNLTDIQKRFTDAQRLTPQKRGYELEKIITDLMRISGIPVEQPFKIVGEQIDGAIKYDGHYYLLEIKWTGDAVEPSQIGSFYFKVEGKMGARGIFISMNGYTSGVTASVPIGREIKVLLVEGIHIANVIAGIYRIQELLEYAVKQATLKGIILCSHNIS